MAAIMILSVVCHIRGQAALAVDNYVQVINYLDSTSNDLHAQHKTTYYDGMGRSRFCVEGVPAEANTWTVTRTDYDDRGNVWRKWLPVPCQSHISDFSNHTSLASQWYGDSETPYSRDIYENDGRNRIAQSFDPGIRGPRNGWSYRRQRNDSTGIYSCRIITAGSSDVSVNIGDIYPRGTLRVSETTDPDGLRTLSFENRSGKTVLERRIAPDGLIADTRFVYDRRGDLRYVIPPEGCIRLPDKGTVSDDVLHLFAQSFFFDWRHRCIRDRIPGCGETEYVYDCYGNMIMSRDALQRQNGEWTVTAYDSRLRPAVRGLVVIPGATRQSLQDLYDDSTIQALFCADINILESTLLYSLPDMPQGFTAHTAWYYDDYRFIVTPQMSSARQKLEGIGNRKFSAHGLCTGMAVTSADGQVWFRAFGHDHRGDRVLECMWDCWLQDSRLFVESLRDFSGIVTDCTETWEQMTEGTVISSRKVTWHDDYDGTARPISKSMSINGNTPLTLSTTSYDALGRMASQWRGCDVCFSYDVRSRPIVIASEPYTEKCSYLPAEQNGADNTTLSYLRLNASSDSWGGIHPYTTSYNYVYDGLGRFRTASDADGNFSESCEVDLDANVRAVSRKFRGVDVQDAVIAYNGQQPTEVRDISTPFYADVVGRFPAGDHTMTYDSLGRVTADSSRGIIRISYHKTCGMPRIIYFDNGDHILSDYLSDGTLLRRSFFSRKLVTVTRVNSKGDTIIRQTERDVGTIHRFAGSFETLSGDRSEILIHTPVGVYKTHEKRHYWYLTNRQGSVTAVIDDGGHTVKRTAYFPSGTPYLVPCSAENADSTEQMPSTLDCVTERMHIGNRWMAHGGLNWYDNTARMHDPLLMRFNTPDPLWRKFADTSPFAHCAADPVNSTDPDGMSTVVEQLDKSRYHVTGGNINDGDLNIYVSGQYNKDGSLRILGQSTLTTSFYNSDKNEWMGTIDVTDNSGQIFWDEIHKNVPGLIHYGWNARKGHKYDFKNNDDKNKSHDDNKNERNYRGMPIRLPDKGTTFISARDLGNYAAGYVWGYHGNNWISTRMAFDAYQIYDSQKLKVEGVSSQNAQKEGWKKGFSVFLKKLIPIYIGNF